MTAKGQARPVGALSTLAECPLCLPKTDQIDAPQQKQMRSFATFGVPGHKVLKRLCTKLNAEEHAQGPGSAKAAPETLGGALEEEFGRATGDTKTHAGAKLPAEPLWRGQGHRSKLRASVPDRLTTLFARR